MAISKSMMSYCFVATSFKGFRQYLRFGLVALWMFCGLSQVSNAQEPADDPVLNETNSDPTSSLQSNLSANSDSTNNIEPSTNTEPNEANGPREDLSIPVELEDLAYGNILFDYYRGKEIEALNGILVAEKRRLLPNHSQSARLLSGVIFLDLGMLTHAQTIFNELLTEKDLQSDLLAKIEFYLGKLHYRHGDFPQAEFRLKRIFEALEPSLRDESLIMLSNMAAIADDKTLAKNWLARVSADSDMAAISRYNLGVLWLREENLEQATFLLTEIHPSYTDDTVVKSLRDKAKVALGYFHLSNKNYSKAREYLTKVRLDSPMANKALLGMGWSYGDEGNYERALAHWLELSNRDIRDLAVQEALLAVPFAYQRLNSLQLSLQKYSLASETFQQQINLIDELLELIESGGLIEEFVKKIVMDQLDSINDDGIEDSSLFGDKYDYYLYELVSQHEFNEGFRSYQKLGKLANILSYWEQQLPAFTDIMKTNQLRFDEKIPLVDNYLEGSALAMYEAMIVQFEEDVTALKNNERFRLLANAEQKRSLKRIDSLFEKIDRLPEGSLSPEQLEKASRAKAVMQWQLEEGKVGKIWQLEKSIIEIRRTLDEMQIRTQALSSARDIAALRFSGYQEEVDLAAESLLGLRDKINAQIAIQARDLKTQISEVLFKRKATLNHYLLQSDLSIARLHEKALKIPELE